MSVKRILGENFMDVSCLIELEKKGGNAKEYHDFLMFELQKHLVEINELKDSKDPHIVNEAADLAILAKMLALSEGADESVFSDRFEKFKQNISSAQK